MTNYKRRYVVFCLLSICWSVGLSADSIIASADAETQDGGQPNKIVKLESEFIAGQEVFLLDEVLPGKVLMSASWKGDSKLALILNGPGRIGYYARKDGKSPLTIEFEVKPDMISAEKRWRLSNRWRVSVINFGGTRIKGTIKITKPALDR